MALLDNSPACNERAIDVASLSFTETTDELCLLLNKLDVKSLLLTHDQLAECNKIATLERQKHNQLLMLDQEDTLLADLTTKSTSHELTSDSSFDKSTELTVEGQYLVQKAEHYGAENLKLVNIEKSETPLGATIRNRDGSVVIGRIVSGGAAEKSGLLHEEDEILEINNVPVRGKTINDICDMLFNTQGLVSFLIIPNMDYETEMPVSRRGEEGVSLI
jgi:C-terminal processing protease CtpA/Prc